MIFGSDRASKLTPNGLLGELCGPLWSERWGREDPRYSVFSDNRSWSDDGATEFSWQEVLGSYSVCLGHCTSL